MIQGVYLSRLSILALASLLLLSTVSVISVDVSGHGTIDQQCSTVGGGYLNGIGDYEPAGQTFTLTQSSVIGFSINVYSVNGVPTPMTAKILAGGIGGTVVGSVDFSIPTHFGLPSGDWIHVHFSSGVPVTPGSLYALDLTDNLASSGVKWNGCSDSYAGGSAYSSGSPNIVGADWSFIIYTGTTATTIDWAISNLWVVPPAPKVGDHITIHALVQGNPPQNVPVKVVCIIDGITAQINFNYPGVPVEVYTQKLLIEPSDVGPHNVRCEIDPPPYQYNDPNRGNNIMTTVFVVAEQPPPPPPTTTVTTVVTTSSTTIAPPADFSITVSPTSITVKKGETATCFISINGENGFSNSVSLAVTPSITGLTAAFNPPSGNPDYSSTLSLKIDDSLAPGTYPLQITATGGGKTHSTSLTLIIEEAGMMTRIQSLLGGYSLPIIALLAIIIIILALKSRKRGGPPAASPPH